MKVRSQNMRNQKRTQIQQEKTKQYIENNSLSNTNTTNRWDWKKGFKVLFY